MKLTDIIEMATPAGKHPEFSQGEVTGAIRFFDDGEATPIEGGKFIIIHKAGSYALKRARDGAILGWVMLGQPKTISDRNVYPLLNIQILPQYRNTVATLMLIHGVKQMLNMPVYVDDIVSTDGQSLLQALSKRPDVAKVYTVDKTTGSVAQYKPGDLRIDDSNALLIEHSSAKLSGIDYFPGGSRTIVYSFFEDYHHEVE